MFSFMNPGKSKPAKKGLKIIIVGCGKVGTTLVEQLSKEGHDIIIIDKNAKKVQINSSEKGIKKRKLKNALYAIKIEDLFIFMIKGVH